MLFSLFKDSTFTRVLMKLIKVLIISIYQKNIPSSL